MSSIMILKKGAMDNKRRSSLMKIVMIIIKNFDNFNEIIRIITIKESLLYVFPIYALIYNFIYTILYSILYIHFI